MEAGAPNFPVGDIFPLIAMFAVANSALINMLMASRLLYGMSKQRVLPPVLGRVLEGRRTPWVAILFTTALASGLLLLVPQLSVLGGTTALLLLAVFTVVNISCLVLRRDPIDRPHFKAPTVLPILGALCCAYLVGPWTGRATAQYPVAGILLAIGDRALVHHLLDQPGRLLPQDLPQDVEDLDSDRDFEGAGDHTS